MIRSMNFMSMYLFDLYKLHVCVTGARGTASLIAAISPLLLLVLAKMLAA
jgi:hypothetical protein